MTVLLTLILPDFLCSSPCKNILRIISILIIPRLLDFVRQDILIAAIKLFNEKTARYLLKMKDRGIFATHCKPWRSFPKINILRPDLSTDGRLLGVNICLSLGDIGGSPKIIGKRFCQQENNENSRVLFFHSKFYNTLEREVEFQSSRIYFFKNIVIYYIYSFQTYSNW